MAMASVAELKSDLEVAQQQLADLQDRARRAADKLIASPTRQNQIERDRTAQNAELVNLTIEKLRRDLAQAERKGWEDDITDFQARQAELKAQGEEIAAELTTSLADASNQIAEFLALRQMVRDLEVKVVGRKSRLGGERQRHFMYSTILLPDGAGLREQVESLLRSIEGFST
jgi:chromosome segregation ATPase